MALQNVSPGMLQTWTKQKTKANRLESCWDELSNRADGLPSIPNAKDGKVPKEVVHYVSTDKNAWKTTIPMLDGLKQDGKGGLQKAEGSGETPDALYAEVYWNLSRKVMNVSVEGVENKSIEYLKVAQESHSMLSDWHAEDKDYRCQQTLIEGGDRYLTDSQFWQDNKEMKTAPLAKRLHPNIAYAGMTTSPNIGKAAFTADVATLKATLSTMTAANAPFSLAALDGAIEYAYRFVKPLKMASGTQAVRYVMLVSPMQAYQLLRDQVWIDLMRGAEKRGPDNRAISGILGVRKNVLVVEDVRSPIFNTEADSGKAFEYVTPVAASTQDSFYGYGKLNRKVKAANSGTMEIARILGAGAIGCPMVGTMEFTDDGKDFGVQKEICATVKCGYNRLDFKGKGANNTEVIRNISSALYFTSTPAITY